MSQICEVCGKKPRVGMQVSHSHHRTKRRWLPNLQHVRAQVSKGAYRRIRICTKCLKAGKVQK